MSLKCTGQEVANAHIMKNESLFGEYFGRNGPVTPPQLKDAFKKCDTC